FRGEGQLPHRMRAPRASRGPARGLTRFPISAPGSPLPGEAPALAGMVPDLVHGLRIEEPAVRHDVPDMLAVADVLERVPAQYHEVRELAGLDRAEVPVQPEVLGTVQCSRADRFQRRHPALGQHPELPVRAQALELPVRAELDTPAPVQDRLGRTRNLTVV